MVTSSVAKIPCWIKRRIGTGQSNFSRSKRETDYDSHEQLCSDRQHLRTQAGPMNVRQNWKEVAFKGSPASVNFRILNLLWRKTCKSLVVSVIDRVPNGPEG